MLPVGTRIVCVDEGVVGIGVVHSISIRIGRGRGLDRRRVAFPPRCTNDHDYHKPDNPCCPVDILILHGRNIRRIVADANAVLRLTRVK